MRNLLKLIKKFILYKNKDKLLILKICVLTGIFRMLILYVPFKKLKMYMGELNKESSKDITHYQYNEACRIRWAIEKVVKYTPWESKCLVQSLTAQYLLSQKKIDSTLYLGVAMDKKEGLKKDFIAHSWIRCGGFFVTGGNGDKFATVAKFRKSF